MIRFEIKTIDPDTRKPSTEVRYLPKVTPEHKWLPERRRRRKSRVPKSRFKNNAKANKPYSKKAGSKKK